MVCSCLILAASAKPTKNKGGKSGKEGKGGNGGKANNHPEKPLVDLCGGLEDGSLTNTDPKFDDVFSELNPVCGSLLTFEKTQTEDEDAGDVAGVETRKKKKEKNTDGTTDGGNGKKGGKNKNGKNGGKNKNGGKTGNNGGNEEATTDVTEIFVGFCQLLRQAIDLGMTDGLSAELLDVLNTVMPICNLCL